MREAAVPVRSADAYELHVRRARGPAASKRAALEVIHAVQKVLEYTASMVWSQADD